MDRGGTILHIQPTHTLGMGIHHTEDTPGVDLVVAIVTSVTEDGKQSI